MRDHYSHPEMYSDDADGFFTARCICGWAQGKFPDIEDTVDALCWHCLTEGQKAAAP